jgi:hypothetical protein
MDSRQGEDESKRDSPDGEDPRALVAALTQQLMVDDGNRAQALPSSTETTTRATRAMNTGISLPDNHNFPPPSTGEDEQETTFLPEFLSDASVRAALHRANALRPQGHLSDEPQFPSALGGGPNGSSRDTG